MKNKKFSKKEYIASEAWTDNEYLLNPITAVKKCLCCDSFLYSAEFPNLDESSDGKLPVCITCLKSRKNKAAVSDIILSLEIARICKKCGNEQHISDFVSYRKKYNDLEPRCSSCRPKLEAWWDTSDD